MDPEIVDRCRRGDRKAQEELYVQTADRIYRLLLRMTQNHDDAFELTQETYLQAFRKIHLFQGSSDISTWIYRIAVNEAKQFIRRQQLHKRTMEKQKKVELIQSEDNRTTIHLDVEQALSMLPESERVMIILRYFDNFSYNQMAEVLGKPPGTIASGLNRARQMLREILESESSSND